MSDCVIQDGRCVRCRWKNHTGDPQVHRNCPASIELQVRSEQEQAATIPICQACPEFIAEEDACRKCGCPSSRREGLASKRRIGNCPLGKW